MERETTCCFTGHRPDRLPWGTRESVPECQNAKERIAQALQRAYDAGFRHFISGMARGSDLYFAEEVLAFRERCPDVTLESARPCPTQSNGWPRAERVRYEALLDQCTYETLVQHYYDRTCMMRRNRYMVDHSARIIALYDGIPKGGTFQTLTYAMKQGLEVDIVSV